MEQGEEIYQKLKQWQINNIINNTGKQIEEDWQRIAIVEFENLLA